MFDQILYGGVSLAPDAEYYFSRKPVEDSLRNAIRKPLTTVVAGAGFGKTQAVSAALESVEENILWFQLSELDNLINRFWERIIFSLKKYSDKLPKKLAALGFPESLAAFDQFLRLFAKEFAEEDRFVFVLDDFHFISNQLIVNFLENLIYARIPNIFIVLISRTKPNISMTELLSKHMLACITEEELRFTKDEMKAYYVQQGQNLSEKMISDIYSYTDGWVVAIYLVGLSVKKGNVNEQNPMSLAKVNLYELIEKEIFLAVSEQVQEFLIKLSILDVVPKDLLLEFGDNNESFVAETAKMSAFIRYDASSESYRIHHLFREFLLERKNKLTANEITKINITAAKWYDRNNYKIEAVRLYEQCKYYSEIFDIITPINKHIEKSVADYFIKLIEQAPAILVETRPMILVVKAYYLINNNKVNEAYKQLSRLRRKYEALPPSRENQTVLGELYIPLGIISIIRQNYEFEELFKLADTFLPDGSALVGNRLNIAEGINITGINSPTAGEITKYKDALFSAMPYASKVMNGCAYGAEYLNAADSCLMTGDIPGAEKNAYEAIFRAEQKQQYGIECMANFILVRVNALRGDFSKTADILKLMKEKLERLNISDCLALYDIIEGWFYIKIGKTDKVRKWIKHEEETRKVLAPVIVGREYLVRSDYLLEEGRFYELLAFMEQQDKVYTERGVMYAVIQNKITRAIIHHYIGNNEEGIVALNEAYEMSHPNNLIIQYIEYGNRMRTVINAARNNPNCTIPKEWLDNIYTKSSTYAKQVAAVATAYRDTHFLEKTEIRLSKREKEILQCLCSGQTRTEIASSCDLSINTVKSMMQRLFSKLGALNSVEAVRIATKLDLI